MSRTPLASRRKNPHSNALTRVSSRGTEPLFSNAQADVEMATEHGAESEHEAPEQDTSIQQRSPRHRRHRTCFEQTEGSVRFERYTALTATGHQRIFYRFPEYPDQRRLDDEVQEIFKSYGRDSDGKGTGLDLKDRMGHGCIWSFPKSHRNMQLAEQLDQELLAFARQIEQQPGRYRIRSTPPGR